MLSDKQVSGLPAILTAVDSACHSRDWAQMTKLANKNADAAKYLLSAAETRSPPDLLYFEVLNKLENFEKGF